MEHGGDCELQAAEGDDVHASSLWVVRRSLCRRLIAYTHYEKNQAQKTKKIFIALIILFYLIASRSLSDLDNRSENLTGRGQILSILKVNSCSIDRKNGEI